MRHRFTSYHLARYVLVFVNFVTVLFVAWVVLVTTELICLNEDGRKVLERMRAVPMHPYAAFVGVTALYIFLVAAVLFRDFFFGKIPVPALVCLSVMDLVLSVAILEMLDFGVRYIFLVPIANAVAYLPDKCWKFGFSAVSILCYLLLDYQILAAVKPVFSIDDYIHYHPAVTRAYLLGARNILFSTGKVFFIAFLVLDLQNILDESQRMKCLNRDLIVSHDKLAVVNTQLQIYAKRAEEMAKIKERNRLAREIHDTVGHCLTGISLGLTAAKEIVRNSPEMIANQLSRLEELACQGLVDIRCSLKELRPDTLERGTLSAALVHLAEAINSCSNRIIELKIVGIVDELNPSLDETVYRVIQESVTNAVRHGDAMHIQVVLNVLEDAITMTISDDGLGCSAIAEGFGIRYMRERVLAHHGFLEIDTLPGEGLTISVYIPRA